MVQAQRTEITQGILAAPTLSRAIASRYEQAMQNCNEHYAFDWKLEATTFQEAVQDGRDAELIPQLLEDKRRTDMDGAAGSNLLALERVEHRSMIAQPRQ